MAGNKLENTLPSAMEFRVKTLSLKQAPPKEGNIKPQCRREGLGLLSLSANGWRGLA